MQITIQLFGALRKYGNGETDSVDIPTGTTVAQLKTILYKRWKDPAISDSVLASETEILFDHQVLDPHPKVSVLPPVCGG